MQHRQIDISHSTYQAALPALGMYVRPEWLELFGAQAKLYGVFKGEELLAVHHTFEYRRAGKDFVIATPMAPHCGFQLLREPETLVAAQADAKRILREVAAFLSQKARKCYVDLALPPKLTDVQPFLWEGLKPTPGYTYLLDCSAHPDALLAAMGAERRKNLRDAAKAGYTITINGDGEAVQKLVADTLKRAGEATREPWLHALLKPENNTWCFTTAVHQDGDLRSVAVVGFQNGDAWYLAGGHTSQDSLAGSWCLWNAILESRRRGVHTFDFLGSSVPTIEQYFRSFGGRLTPWFRIGGGQGIIPVLKNLKKRLAK